MKSKRLQVVVFFKWLLKILIPIFFLGIIVIRFSPGEIFKEIRKVSLMLFSVFVLGHFLLLSIKAYRWKLLLDLCHIEVAYSNALKAYIAGYSFGILTPGQLGDMGKVMLIDEARGKRMQALVPSFADRLWDLSALIIMSILCSFIVFWRSLYIANIFWLFAGFLVFVLLIGPLVYRFIKRVFIKQMEVEVVFFQESFFSAIALTLFSIFVQFSRLILLAYAMGLPVVIAASSAIIGNLVALIPITIGGLGTREATIATLFAYSGINPAAGVSFSLLMFCSHLIGAVCGLCLLPFLNIDIKGRKENNHV